MEIDGNIIHQSEEEEGFQLHDSHEMEYSIEKGKEFDAPVILFESDEEEDDREKEDEDKDENYESEP